MAESVAKSFKSACVIIPPASVWRQIQNIRRQHDRAYARWMPHINLLYPFLEDTTTIQAKRVFELEVPRIYKHFQEIQPFHVAFTKDSFCCFNHGNNSTVYLRPLPLGDRHEELPAYWLPQCTMLPESQTVHTGNNQGNHFPPKVSPVQPYEIVSQVHAESITTVEVLPPCPVPDMLRQTRVATGFDALADAVWSPDECTVPDDIPSSGIDALRTAIWKPGDRDRIAPDGRVRKKTRWDNPVSRTIGEQPTPSPHINQGLQCLTGKTADWTHVQFDVPQQKQGIECAMDQNDRQCILEQNAEWTTVQSKKPVKDKVDIFLTADTGLTKHEKLLQLQCQLEQLYPQCNDLRLKSDDGLYQPHLSLGQWKTKSVAHLIASLKEDWVDIYFEVQQIHFISRKGGNLDPFVIQTSVPLGKS